MLKATPENKKEVSETVTERTIMKISAVIIYYRVGRNFLLLRVVIRALKMLTAIVNVTLPSQCLSLFQLEKTLQQDKK